ncbi:MFS transporter [Sporosarcina soli]|uniref:MFS transporter n=1 Tax=Sporosarcina soli TaxID=334736 RepID=A0ABW0TRA0_9BACL
MAHEGYKIKDLQFWKIIISLGLGSIFIFASMYAVQPLLPVFTEEFDIPVAYASLSLSMTTIGLIIGLIVLGFFSDRNGRSLYIKLSLIGSLIPFLLMTLTDYFLLIIILRFIQGFALAGVPAAALAYISEEIHKQFASIATALYISSNALGGMIGRVLTGYITEQSSWESAFYVLAAGGAIVFFLLLLTLPSSRNFKPSNTSFRKDIEGFLFHLRNPSLMVAFGLGIVLQLSFTGIWTYLPFYLTTPPFLLSLETVSYTFYAYGFGVVGSPLAGWLAGKFGLSKVRVTGIFVLALGILLTMGESIVVVIIGLCFTCLGFFTAHSLTAASVSSEAQHHKGSASSLYLVSYYVGVAAGSTLLSPLWEVSGWNGIVLFTSILPIIYVGWIALKRKRWEML